MTWRPVSEAPAEIARSAVAHPPKLGELIYKLYLDYSAAVWVCRFDQTSKEVSCYRLPPAEGQ